MCIGKRFLGKHKNLLICWYGINKLKLHKELKQKWFIFGLTTWGIFRPVSPFPIVKHFGNSVWTGNTLKDVLNSFSSLFQTKNVVFPALSLPSIIWVCQCKLYTVNNRLHQYSYNLWRQWLHYPKQWKEEKIRGFHRPFLYLTTETLKPSGIKTGRI